MARRGSLIVYARCHATLDQPITPPSWDVVQEADRIATCYPLGRTNSAAFFHARLMFRKSGAPGRALFVCVGAPLVLQRLVGAIAADALPWTFTWADLPSFRSDARAPVVTLRSEWPDERPHAWSGTPAAPVDGGPIGTLVALWSRMAGWPDDDGEG